MPTCSKCAGTIYKNKAQKAWRCKRCGFVRKINSPKPVDQQYWLPFPHLSMGATDVNPNPPLQALAKRRSN